MDVVVKQEAADGDALPRRASLPGPTARLPTPSSFIDLSSGSDSESDEIAALKKPRAEKAIPDDFLRLLPPDDAARRPPAAPSHRPRQFWKAGEFDAPTDSPSLPSSAGMDHVRVHPKFLHSNATSHKWALGAFAELLDNALDEVRNGATYVNVDVLVNKKDNSRMLLVEDNGGGMDPDKMRQCMSLGYSAKSKLANTIGQYGNGFKTSTMRLGADVIVFSRHCGKDGKLPTQSIGMLSYSFLTKTGKEDIVVPMLDFEKKGSFWSKMVRSSLVDWDTNLETILKWSPYLSEADLLQEFNLLTEQGTRILIYNLWDDEDGRLELDFSADRHDIQLGGVNRDERKIQMASQFPNSRHFLTYQHSLRSYSSILYRRLPSSFKIILRGKEIEHHDIVNDMMLSQEVTYRPQAVIDSFPKDPSLVAVVTIGFVKDARDHIDVQGFNVYHKNRLIKPFWRVWNASGSDGRGVIGVLEANFVEPAHDKQGFERTTVLSRLESRLVQMQKHYWSSNCHRIGYAPRRNKKAINDSHNRDSSPEDLEGQSGQYYRMDVGRNSVSPAETPKDTNRIWGAGKSVQFSKAKCKGEDGHKNVQKSRKRFKTVSQHPDRTHYYSESDSEAEQIPSNNMTNGSRDFKPVCADESLSKAACCSVSPSLLPPECTNGNRMEEDDSNRRTLGIISVSDSKGCIVNVMGNEITTLCNEIINPELFIQQLKEENFELKERLKRTEESLMHDLEQEKERCKVLTEKLEETEAKLEQANREQEALIDIFSDERIRRDKEEETLRNKLKDAAMTIQELLHKLANKSGA